MKIVNCWEFKKCGREPGGDKVNELGVCPAAIDDKYNGLNKGKNAGRACWLMSGTLCDIKVKGKRHKRQWECTQCFFFQIVKEEEGDNFVYHIG